MPVTREELLTFLNKKTRSDLSKISDDTELFSSGLVDSFALIEVVQWLEKKTGARFNYSDITVDNFDTVELILAYAAKHAR